MTSQGNTSPLRLPRKSPAGALAHGFVVRHVEEPLRPEPVVDDDEAPEPVDDPAIIVWDFELAQPLPR